MRRLTARREEGGEANERIPPRVEQVPIVGLEEENEEVPLQEPQVPSSDPSASNASSSFC